ncbi:MAG: fdxN element excision recombinase XisF [Nodosilinea sp.]
MRVIGYTRISSNSPEQLKALEQHKARLTAAGCTEVYWDIASRSKDDREELNVVLGILEQKQCDRAVFIRLDRMTDSPAVLERAIRICLESGIPIVGLDDHIDFETVGGRLEARILCNLAKAEVERLSDRVKHGYEHMRNKNLALHPPFGYRRVKGKMELNQDLYLCLSEGRQELSQAEVARDLVELFLTHQSLRETLRQFNQRYGLQQFVTPGGANRKARRSLGFTPVGLGNWLNNPILQGHTAYGRQGQQRLRHQSSWDIRRHTHPDQVLMTADEAQRIEDLLRTNAQQRGWKPTKIQRLNPLSRLVYCGECRGYCPSTPYKLKPEDVRHNYYQCKSYTLGACPQKTMVKGYAIEDAIIEALIQRAGAISAIAQIPAVEESPPELQALRAELVYYQDAPGRRAEALVADLRQQIEAFQQKRQVATVATSEQRELLLQVFGDSLYWKTLMDEEKKEIYRALVERVAIKDGQVERVELRV